MSFVRTYFLGAFAMVLLLAMLPALAFVRAAHASEDGVARKRQHNWSGYAVNARSPFRTVEGNWTMPEVTCHRGQKSTISFWVGLGGFATASKKIEQVGADTECGTHGGTTRYAWIELYPDPTIEIPVEVQSGDEIAAGVSVNGSRVSMHLDDLTRGSSFSRTLSMRSPGLGSAEWIGETTPVCNLRYTKCKFLPAPRFDPVEIGGARTATAGEPMSGIDSGRLSVTRISLIDHAGRLPSPQGFPPLWGSNTRVIPSQLSTDRESFTEIFQRGAPMTDAKALGPGRTSRRWRAPTAGTSRKPRGRGAFDAA